jgi:hypothetical protein
LISQTEILPAFGGEFFFFGDCGGGQKEIGLD